MATFRKLGADLKYMLSHAHLFVIQHRDRVLACPRRVPASCMSPGPGNHRKRRYRATFSLFLSSGRAPASLTGLSLGALGRLRPDRWLLHWNLEVSSEHRRPAAGGGRVEQWPGWPAFDSDWLLRISDVCTFQNIHGCLQDVFGDIGTFSREPRRYVSLRAMAVFTVRTCATDVTFTGVL